MQRIDSSRAEALPGVWLVWRRYQPSPIDLLGGREGFAHDLASQGAEVAFVAADGERIAEERCG